MRKTTGLLLAIVLLTACAKQTTEMPPGTAIITNLKTGLNISAIAIVATSAALPAFKLDAEDQATAQSILADVSAVRGVLSERLGPYTSFDSSNAEQIKQAGRDGLATVRELHDKRVDHIKNPQARAQVDTALSALEAVLNTIIDLKQPA